jgi:hypothetical protein
MPGYGFGVNQRRIVMYFNGMRSSYTKIKTLFHIIIKYLYMLIINIICMDLYGIHCVLNYKYVGGTDEKSDLTLNRQGRMDRLLPCLDALGALHSSF